MVGDQAPELRSALVRRGTPWRAATTSHRRRRFVHRNPSCGDRLRDLRSTRTLHPTAAADVKYGLVYGNTTRQRRPVHDGPEPAAPNLRHDGQRPRVRNSDVRSAVRQPGCNPDGVRHAIALRVRLKNTTSDLRAGQINCADTTFSPTCEWYYTGTGTGRRRASHTRHDLPCACPTLVHRGRRRFPDRSSGLRLTPGGCMREPPDCRRGGGESAVRPTTASLRDGAKGRLGDGPGRAAVRVQLQGESERCGRLRRTISELEDRGRCRMPPFYEPTTSHGRTTLRRTVPVAVGP